VSLEPSHIKTLGGSMPELPSALSKPKIFASIPTPRVLARSVVASYACVAHWNNVIHSFREETSASGGYSITLHDSHGPVLHILDEGQSPLRFSRAAFDDLELPGHL
jgi:hypothetical protein